MPGRRIKVCIDRISPILPIKKLVANAMARTFEPSDKEGQTLTIKYLPYGENMVKIGTVDPEIICLKCLF